MARPGSTETEESLIGIEADGVAASAVEPGLRGDGVRTVTLLPRFALSACVFGLSAANGVVLLRAATGEFMEALAQQAASALETRPCHIATAEDSDFTCYRDIAWVLADGGRRIRENPELFPGLSPSSPFEDVQSFLHEHAPERSRCPLPCSVGACHIATRDDVDQTCFRATYAALGDGVREHPERYPGLSTSSGFADFQRHFHEHQPEMSCPPPCLAPEPAFYGLAWTLLAALALLPAFVVVGDWARGETEWKYRFFSLYLSMLVPLNTNIYAWAKWGFLSTHPRYENFGRAWQWLAPAWVFAYAWAFLCIVQHIHRPVGALRGRRAVLGLLGTYLGVATATFYVCCTGGMSAVPKMTLGFPLDSQSLLPIMSLTMAEAVRFVNTAEPQGMLAVLPMFALCSTFPFWLFRGHIFTHWMGEKQDLSLYLTISSAVEALVLLLAGCDFRSRLVSTSWQYAGAGSVSRSCLANITDVLLSWRGQNCLCLLNGVFSLAVFQSQAATLKASLNPWPWDTSGEEAFDNISIFVDGTIVLSGISVLLSTVGLVADIPAGNHTVRTLLSWMPIDRHFRYMTVIKATMLWLQLEVLLCSDLGTSSGEVGILVVGQFLAAVGSALIGLFTPFCVLLRSQHLMRFCSSHRGGKLLPTSAAVCALLLQLLACVLLVGRVLGPQSAVMRALGATSAGVFLTFPLTYLLGFACLLNELRWSLAAVDLQQPHFSAVVAPSGVWALAACAAVKFPLQALLEFVYNQWLRPWYVQDLLTGYAAQQSPLVGGGRPVGGLLPPLVTYCTVALALAGICAGWASASPLAGGMRRVAPPRTLATSDPKSGGQEDGHREQVAAGAAGAVLAAGSGVASPVAVNG